ncbi:MAG: hypothetical protein JW795_17585 [Chitinivibrionales bacterium]|nr:hypothetical protein [Chitinivibrionales bacterium]
MLQSQKFCFFTIQSLEIIVTGTPSAGPLQSQKPRRDAAVVPWDEKEWKKLTEGSRKEGGSPTTGMQPLP